jgi:dihydroxy-acid dehydratase
VSLQPLEKVEIQFLHDGRFSGGTHGFVVGHITPEAHVGGTLAIIENGDKITINAETKKLTLHVDDTEISARLAKWQQPAPKYTRGVLAKYAKLVKKFDCGAHEYKGRNPETS